MLGYRKKTTPTVYTYCSFPHFVRLGKKRDSNNHFNGESSPTQEQVLLGFEEQLAGLVHTQPGRSSR